MNFHNVNKKAFSSVVITVLPVCAQGPQEEAAQPRRTSGGHAPPNRASSVKHSDRPLSCPGHFYMSSVLFSLCFNNSLYNNL